jgi:hypothetical protein
MIWPRRKPAVKLLDEDWAKRNPYIFACISVFSRSFRPPRLRLRCGTCGETFELGAVCTREHEAKR